MGSAVIEFMTDNGYFAKVKRMGLPDRLVEHGTQLELHTECGFHPEGIVNKVREMILDNQGLMVS